MPMNWGKKRAKASTYFVPPSKPSYSELCIYTKYLRKLQKKSKKKIELLILGSTSEFRDLAYEQSINATIVDYSHVYYKESGRTRRHRSRKEKFIHEKWQDMNFKNKFDLIVGDLVIFNLKSHELDGFLQNIARALTKNGLFITKSYFKNSKVVPSLESIFRKYYKSYSHYHPFSVIVHDLYMYFLKGDKETINFKEIYASLKSLYSRGIIKKDILYFFNKLQFPEIEADLYIPTFETWENKILKYFKKFKKEYSDDIYSKDIPLYIISKK